MFKVGDKVARRDTPTVLFGVVEATTASDVVSVSVNGYKDYFYASNGQRNDDEGDLDIVPFEEVIPAGEKKFWIVREMTSYPPLRCPSEDAAVREAIELAQRNPNLRYGVFESISQHEVNAVTSIKFR